MSWLNIRTYLGNVYHKSSAHIYEMTLSFMAGVDLVLLIFLIISVLGKAGDLAFLTPTNIQLALDVALITTGCVGFLFAGVRVSESTTTHRAMLIGEMWKLEVKQQSSSYWAGRSTSATLAPGSHADMKRTHATVRSVLTVMDEMDAPPRALGFDITADFRSTVFGAIVTILIAIVSYIYQMRQDKGDPYGLEGVDYLW